MKDSVRPTVAPPTSSRTVPPGERGGWTGADIAIGGVALAAAYALKTFYSTATADQLVWILAPTVSLVELGTGATFFMEAGEGYLSRELNLLVAPSCAGVNFLVAALCTGALGLSRTAGTTRGKTAVALGVVVGAYLLTVFANTLRLLTSLSLGTAERTGALSGDQLHRVEGVAIYFTILCVSYLVAHRLLSRGAMDRGAGRRSPVGREARGGTEPTEAAPA